MIILTVGLICLLTGGLLGIRLGLYMVSYKTMVEIVRDCIDNLKEDLRHHRSQQVYWLKEKKKLEKIVLEK